MTSEPVSIPLTTDSTNGPLRTDASVDASARESWRSEELLGDRTEVQILHNNEVYRLRRTRQGKLILHK